MATNRQMPFGKGSISGPSAGDWNEEMLETGLQRLKALHIKLRDLRTAIPRMLRPFTLQPYPSRKSFDPIKMIVTAYEATAEHLFSLCQASMRTAVGEIKDLRALIQSEAAKVVLEHADRSRRINPKGIKPWRPRDETSWASLG